MRERIEKILRVSCVILCALVVLQFVHAVFQACRLVGVKIPPVPVLSADTNAPVATEADSRVAAARQATNAGLMPSNSITPAVEHAGKSNLSASNAVALARANGPSNGAPMRMALASGARRRGPMMPPMMGGPGFGKPAALPAGVQAQVDTIVNSEILGPTAHPLPMALLGIAGDTAFLRTADGQTGLVKAGDSLGTLRLLQIGINRVLVEQDGQKKELMIFDGYGGDSLLSKQDQKSK